MKTRALLIALLLAAPAAAQVAYDSDKMQDIGEAKKKLAEKLQPAKVDGEKISRLTHRMIREAEYQDTEEGPAWVFEGVDIFDKSEDKLLLTVRLFGEQAEPREIGEPGSGFIDLALRYNLERLQGISQRTTDLPDGFTQVDQWVYELGLDGTINSVTHSILVINEEPPLIRVDKARSRIYQMSPRDPAVQNRWKQLEQKFMLLGPTVEA